MNFPDLDSGTPELGTFVAALKQVFHGEAWDEIERYAERAWRACGLEEETAWTNVRDQVKARWPNAPRE